MRVHDLTWVLGTIKRNKGNCRYVGGTCSFCSVQTNYLLTPKDVSIKYTFWICHSCGFRNRISNIGRSMEHFSHPKHGPLGSVIDKAFQTYKEQAHEGLLP